MFEYLTIDICMNVDIMLAKWAIQLEEYNARYESLGTLNEISLRKSR